ncbi:MAG: hypothetical protein APR63_00720 [Desulfuromonas sp. SDB]|nr:MAG: hypothetical protein APR63_00720 [Desulfuromonas sp. SDB]
MKIISLIVIIIGFVLIFLQVNSILSFAHLHPEWVGEAGKKLINESTNEETAGEFLRICEQHDQQVNVISQRVITLNLISAMLGIILILLGMILFAMSFKINRQKIQQKE